MMFTYCIMANCYSINVSVRRLGGAYGSKISRQNILATAAAVAAKKLRQPVRFVVDLNTNMMYAGWREPYYSNYEVCITIPAQYM